MQVRVMGKKCDTCIFHPGNRMNLMPGRVKGMVEEVIRTQGHIPCHETLFGNRFGVEPAVCKGMAEHPVAGQRSIALRLGKALKIIVEVFLPTKENPVNTRESAGQGKV